MKKIKFIVVGYGNRAAIYCRNAMKLDKNVEFVACVDPDTKKLVKAQKELGVSSEMCFTDLEELVRYGKIADCVINGTMDKLHLQTALPFLELGYDMLLEKPLTNNAIDLIMLKRTAEKNNCKLITCHVLRYTPFYKKIKELLLDGAIGKTVHIETSERVCIPHSSSSYIRGKWNNESVCGSSYLLAKCCHDIDLLCWFNNSTTPETVISFGGRDYLIPENAPKGAGNRCLVDCPHVDDCIYSAKWIYVENDYLKHGPWQMVGLDYDTLTKEQKIESLKTDNPHGICAYKIKSDLIDHQEVMVKFKDGSTATHSLLTTASRATRSIFIQGTRGEIEGDVVEGKFVLRAFNKETLKYDVEEFNFNDRDGETGGHFGGDEGIVRNLLSILKGDKPTVSYSPVQDSINGHLLVYAADKSLKENKIINVAEEYGI